jgi:hypothetical protein
VTKGSSEVPNHPKTPNYLQTKVLKGYFLTSLRVAPSLKTVCQDRMSLHLTGLPVIGKKIVANITVGTKKLNKRLARVGIGCFHFFNNEGSFKQRRSPFFKHFYVKKPTQTGFFMFGIYSNKCL